MPLFYSIVKKVFITVFFVVAVMILSGIDTADAQQAKNTFIVMGTGNVKKENVSAARQEAIKNCLITAVGLKATDLMNIDSMVQNYEALNETLYTNIDKFIRGYKVLTEARSESTYRVMVQVTVSSKMVKRKLTAAGIMQGKMVMPKILFFIAEQSLEDGSPKYWWGRGMPFVNTASEKAIVEVMKEKGFKIIKHGPRIQNMAFRIVAGEPNLNDREAIDFAAKMNADVIIIGSSIADNLSNTMGADMKSFKGLTAVRALLVKTGKQIGSTSRTAVTANVNEIIGGRDALSGAGTLAGEEIARQVVSAWLKKDDDTEKFEILLKGAGNLANFVMFRRMLSTIEGVKFVQVKELKSDKATISVDFNGKTKELAAALMLKAFESFGINIYEVSDSQLKIELIGSQSHLVQ
ncbi:MAG: hypothetical protein JRF60_00250 [Deltaproteobacteria bacterium]|nr:hypothetical protein [Deltaproteobacteria bacterium]MBW2563271.1 hypothetical protein [Deltaproteobacteria bacterium]